VGEGDYVDLCRNIRLMHIIVITGATSGIGAEAAKILSRQADTLIIAGARSRNVPEGMDVYPLDLSSLKSV
jgi:NAD(P)-dependent dehydrogenase (short-subunit alcohol dehydrogenase family)